MAIPKNITKEHIEQALQYPISAYSWTVLSDQVCIKELDKSAFLHSGTGIPKDLREFFSITNIGHDENIAVTLKVSDTSFEAYFALEPQGRTRLFWHSDFESLLRKTYPELYNAALTDTLPENGLPYLQFEVLTEDRPIYRVEMIDSKPGNIRPLALYEDYTRQEVHDIFDSDSRFTPQTGTWGFLGIVKIPKRQKDFVFFVTFGSVQGEHTFDEGITEDGILTWQSQPSQKLSTPQIKDFINHNHLADNIYLFLRTSKKNPYTYLSKLAYLTHDNEREKPVWFKWQILDWDLPSRKAAEIGLLLQTSIGAAESPEIIHNQLIETPPPLSNEKATSGKKTSDFRGRHFDFAESDIRNRKLGLAGEHLVLEMERQALVMQNKPDLAEKMQHTSVIEGDGAGYDILSYTPNGEIKYIEVKTTTGGAGTPFNMSANEVAFSEQYPSNYYLIRVYEYVYASNSGKFYVQRGYVGDGFEMEAIQFKLKK